MKTLINVYNEIEKNNIEIINTNFKNKKSAIISNKVDTAICIDYSKIENSKEEKVILAEEKAHYDTGSFYHFNSPYELIDKMEYKARKRVYNELIPYDILKELAPKLSLEELSEYFEVPIKDIIMASFLYSNIENYAK